MIDKRRAIAAGITLMVAAGAGHFMQNGGVAAERFSQISGADSASKAKNSAPESLASENLVPALPAEIELPTLARMENEVLSTRVAALEVSLDTTFQSDVQTPSPFALGCDVSLSATTIPGAMVELTVFAPCHGNAVMTVNHAGLEFTGITDEMGHYQVVFPAFQSNARISARFSDGTTSEVSTIVPEAEGYYRSVLMWTGESGLHIHALEYGAEYGENGHVWAEDARNPEFGTFAKGGFLTSLGESNALFGKFAEIYSFPEDRISRDGTVRIIVEAEVTPTTCGQNILGRTLERGQDGVTREAGLKLSMPTCESTGDFLVLKNLLQDLKIARN